MPPVAKLTNEPKAAFSSCFGMPFLTLHPTIYARILEEKIKKHKSQAYLVNTGWSGGGYGVGKRIDLAKTRQIVSDILSGKMAHADYQELRPFGLLTPKQFNPKNTWADKAAYEAEAKKLAALFKDNFRRFKK